jgi:hypothetical protein
MSHAYGGRDRGTVEAGGNFCGTAFCTIDRARAIFIVHVLIFPSQRKDVGLVPRSRLSEDAIAFSIADRRDGQIVPASAAAR